VRLGAHRHKIDRDEAAEVAQSDLPRRFSRRCDVQIERKPFRIARSLSCARIHIDSHQRRRRLNAEHAAAWQRREAGERILDHRVDFRARLRVSRFCQDNLFVNLMLSNAMRNGPVMASFLQLHDRVFAARGLTRNVNNHAHAFG
jgi:hypothetical protein